MADLDKAQARYNKLIKLSGYHQVHQKIVSFLQVASFICIGGAWILTLFMGFTLPFFFLHSLGTAIWLYQYTITETNLKSRWDYLTDPMFLFLVLVTMISSIYVIISAGRCSLSG
jgi:hypothetical protein